MTTHDVLEAAKPWMQQCGRCDADLPMACTCPPADPRPIVSALIAEIEQLRRRLAAIRKVPVHTDADGRQVVYAADLMAADAPERARMIAESPVGSRLGFGRDPAGGDRS